MPPELTRFLQRWILNTLAVLVTAHILRGIHYDTVTGLLVATLVLGILNAFVRPILLFLSLPFLVVTLGLFMFVINALLLLFVSWILPTFHVDGFWWAFLGALIISIISVALGLLTGLGGGNVRVNRSRPRTPPRRDRDDGGGPVIDV